MRLHWDLAREGLLRIHAALVLAGLRLHRDLAREGLLRIHAALVLAGLRLHRDLAREGLLRRITVGVLVAHGVSLVSGVVSSYGG
ncbi:hypothetical protein APY09_05785 [Schaalia odontolytica]|uniref:Uncharacterized protein n=1 Tax=Schaalia odontolytica TaxID=1660 RepID=A0A0V8RS93_9ACTO|nr:hypothetical protein APY09_05785 [Schaalia odontolytica]